MATRIYITSGNEFDASGDSTLTGFGFDSAWFGEATGISTFHRYGWADIANIGTMPHGHATRPNNAMTSFQIMSGSSPASDAFYYAVRVYLGPLKAGGVITGGATNTLGVVCRTSTFTNTHQLTAGLRVINYDGTVQKEIEPPNSGFLDPSFWGTSFTSRWDTSAGATGDYTIVAGDWIVAELGFRLDFVNSQTAHYELGDDASTDVTSTDTTAARNSYIELGTTTGIEIEPSGVPNQLMLVGVGT